MNIAPITLLLSLSLSFLMTSSHASEQPEVDSMNKLFIEDIQRRREKAGLVSLSVLVVKGGEIVLSASSGERKKGSGVAIGDRDKWHIGSITKSFTSTMIARLIEKEQFRWDTRVGEVFQEADIDDAWREVTLSQLLTHTSGAKPNFSFYTSLYKEPKSGETLSALREREVLNALRKPPKETPGSTFLYSNLGYIIAATMSEKVTGLSWKELIAQEVVTPLDMQSTEFDPPQTKEDELEQPVGHRRVFGFTFAASRTSDNSPILAPAGRLYLPLQDLATFANDHLQGHLGEGKLLQPETYRRLHTPVMAEYGYGWVTKAEQEWSKGDMLWHNGSNGLWHTLMVLVPESDTIVLVATNDGNISVAEENAWEIVKTALTTLGDR